MYILMDGKKISSKIFEELKKEIKNFKRMPKLVIFFIGNDKNSELYIKNKVKGAKTIGVKIDLIKLDSTISQQELIKKIKHENNNHLVDGIIVQLPLPKHIDRSSVAKIIEQSKDVDGLNPINQNSLFKNRAGIVPPTALGVKKLLDFYNIKIKNKKIVVVGQGEIAGLPISRLLTNFGGNVLVCTKETKDISIFTKKADILISAAGKKFLINKTNIKKGSIIINVGFDQGYGDVDFENIKEMTSYISPIKGGTGPLTIAFLLKNVVDSYKIKLKRKNEENFHRN